MIFFNYMFSPKLFKEYFDGPLQKFYEPGGLERISDHIFSSLSMVWNITYYTSPLIITFLYRRGYFVAESITPIARISTGIGILVVISLCMRSYGRFQTRSYRKFLESFELVQTSGEIYKNDSVKNALRKFDFDFKYWPIDFSVADVEGSASVRKDLNSTLNRNKPLWISSLPCEIAAYIAIHTFGLRLIYPGSIKILQNFLSPMLIQGRAKLIEEDGAIRYKLQTKDNNEIDSLFIDNRNSTPNGKYLVICSEGNAGFYEIGILATPLSLKYSVLGWNHPGFGGSTGKPFPAQDQNAMDAVIQFAIHELGYPIENIILFGWSIGGYSTLWAAVMYPDIKGIILDATFDDLIYLAIPRMPLCISGIVRIAIRDYVNLHNSELISKFNGPVLMIRRTEDEVIAEDMNLSTNRGNYLLISFLKIRFPNIFRTEQINYITKLLSKPIDKAIVKDTDDLCTSLLITYVSEFGKTYPLEIGADFTIEQRNSMAEFLMRKHFFDFKSNHCTPLPMDFFQIPWDLPNEDNGFYII